MVSDVFHSPGDAAAALNKTRAELPASATALSTDSSTMTSTPIMNTAASQAQPSYKAFNVRRMVLLWLTCETRRPRPGLQGRLWRATL